MASRNDETSLNKMASRNDEMSLNKMASEGRLRERKLLFLSTPTNESEKQGKKIFLVRKGSKQASKI
jgi:hypothetical protein